MTALEDWYCDACCSFVEVAIQETARSVVPPAFLGALGAASAGRRATATERLGLGLLGVGLGLIVNEVTQEAQKIVCKNCGCSHVRRARVA